MVGIISLANSNEYDKNDLEVIQRLADLYAIAITGNMQMTPLKGVRKNIAP
jgi:hypothetical protein